MENIVKMYQKKFRKVKEEMAKWEELQSRLVSQFVNAASIIQRLQTIQDCNNYGVLRCVEGIQAAVFSKQMDSLNNILSSMRKTMKDFQDVASAIEKILYDSKQLTEGGSARLTPIQKQQRVGLKPSVDDCLDGLKLIAEIYRSEYQLKQTVVSEFAKLALTPSACEDLVSLQRLLVDQPNISVDEVQYVLDIIFAE